MYYAMHNHSLEGFGEKPPTTGGGSSEKTETTVRKSGPPVFKAAWKMELPKQTRRFAVADLAGDKKPRLLILGASSTLWVYTLRGEALDKEASFDLGENAGSFVVGKFAKGKPALVVVPGAIFYRDMDKYAKKDAPDLREITGSVRFKDGTENIFFFSGAAPDTWSVNLTGSPLLEKGRQMVTPDMGGGVYAEMVARLPGEVLAGLGAPAGTQKIGIVGFFDPRSSGTLFAWLPIQENDIGYVVVANHDVISMTGQAGKIDPIWKSPVLQGRILDVALGFDPQTGKKPGIYVLHSSGDDDKGRTVQFFALD